MYACTLPHNSLNRSVRFAGLLVACLLMLTACGGGGSAAVSQTPQTPPAAPPTEPVTDPAPSASSLAAQLRSTRFTKHQPDALKQVGAHHAYARGLTGKGVRIGIEDDIVDYTQRAEFGDRVKLRDADGAVLSYSRPFGDVFGSDVDRCQRNRTCDIWDGNSGGDEEAYNRWVREIVREDDWPTREDSVFVLDEYYREDGTIRQLLRWREVPTPYGQVGSHGTIVASVAAGKNLGVAPEATIIPIARNFEDQRADSLAESGIRSVISGLSAADRGQYDDNLVEYYRDNYARFDIINRSFGVGLFDPDAVAAEIDSELGWWRRYLPKSLDAIGQVGTRDADKTIIVYAAGNEGEPWSSLEADLPFWISDVRGHHLSVAATAADGSIADYSNRCGPLPSNWNAARHGRHYCLTAPGTVRGLVPNANSPGRGDVRGGITGTSFAAPIVSGALALLMEHFRGTRGNTEVVKRMLDTADRSGRYADLETYGAGHLDIEAALSPVGALNAGQSAHALSQSALQIPAAFGSVAQRAAHIELAAFDEQNFPFWVPLSELVSTRTARRSPIPVFEGPYRTIAPAAGLDAVGLHSRMSLGNAGNPAVQGDREWVMSFGDSAIGLEQRPRSSGWGYGFSLEESGYLGAQPSGAFGSDLRSGMLWTSRAFEHGLGDGWKLGATGTLAVSLPDYENQAIFQATSSVLSALAMRIGKQDTGLIVEQPLRAESGAGTFRIENGRVENGRRLYDEYRIPLQAQARELRMTLRHQRQTLGGDLAIEVGGALNAGHTAGERETSIGFAYRRSW